VEGYSNLLWVLASSALGAIGVDLVLSLRILGLVCSSLTMAGAIACAVTASGAKITVSGGRGHARQLAHARALGPLAVWAIGGLEQPLLACLLAFAGAASIALLGPLENLPPRQSALAGLLFGLLGVTRPDGILFGAAAFIALYLFRARHSSAGKHAAYFGISAITPVLAQLVFRLLYYRDWVPNTAYAKLVLQPTRAAWGLGYLQGAAVDLWPILGLAALALLILVLKKAVASVHIFLTHFRHLVGLCRAHWRRYFSPLIDTSSLIAVIALLFSLRVAPNRIPAAGTSN